MSFEDILEEEIKQEQAAIIAETIAETTELIEPAAKPKPESKTQVLAQSQVNFLSITDIDTGFRIAKAFAMSGAVPACYKENAEGKIDVIASRLLFAMQLGAEVGLPPAQSIQNICIVNERPAIWGDAMLGLVMKSNLLESITETVEGDKKEEMIATCKVKRRNMVEIERSFSWADAVLAGLATKAMYGKYPKRMLAMRARAFALRDMFPDVLKGLTHTVEEIGYIEESKATTLKNKINSIDGDFENVSEL